MLKAPARLAVACRSGGGGSKLLIYMVAGGPGGTTPAGQHVQLLAKVPVQVRVHEGPVKLYVKGVKVPYRSM